MTTNLGIAEIRAALEQQLDFLRSVPDNEALNMSAVAFGCVPSLLECLIDEVQRQRMSSASDTAG